MSNAPADAVDAGSEPAGASRRCWRCLQQFACTADDIQPGPTEWWLCDPCSRALMGRPGRG